MGGDSDDRQSDATKSGILDDDMLQALKTSGHLP